jgi:hypothetical protein
MFLSKELFLKNEYNKGEGNRGRDNVQRCSACHANSPANQSTDNRVKYTQEVQEWPF